MRTYKSIRSNLRRSDLGASSKANRQEILDQWNYKRVVILVSSSSSSFKHF